MKLLCWAVIVLSKPGRKENAWVSEVLAPRCQLTDTSKKCLERIKTLYDLVIQGWTPQVAAGHSSSPVEPQTTPQLAPPTTQVAVAQPHPPAAPPTPQLAPPTTQVAVAQPHPPAAPPTPQLAAPTTQVAVAQPHPPAAPPTPPKSLILSVASTGASQVCQEKGDSVEGGCPAPSKVVSRKRKECLHTLTGSQDFYPVKRVAKCKVVKVNDK
ncbi:nascent polypeptide-associated complex subunit alpha, muscle-specific form isoform X2 [Perca flavescens]|uniref:nascent polypeptide-associated complex subunit alpha, muscle-specific form isoform X2 n=1 Tax=Perca flavescens TaxID=8167 RepID=UPI00106EAC4E|nr:nascent polypeptide-associated complex subunit alpha, muscle-specific form-like isoform X2 [Perca flavescens]